MQGEKEKFVCLWPPSVSTFPFVLSPLWLVGDHIRYNA